jgi:hypothetical protein
MKKRSFFSTAAAVMWIGMILTFLAVLPVSAQVAINTDGASPDGSAMLDVKSTSRGILIPRMTAAQRSAIGSPVNGLMVYQTDGVAGIYVYGGSGWLTVGGSGFTGSGGFGQVAYWTGSTTLTGNANLYWDNANARLGIGTVLPSQKLTIEGTLGILEGGSTPSYHTIFQGGDQNSNITYTLPIDDGTTGQMLTTDGTGVLTWTSAGTVSGTGTSTRVAFWNGASSLSSNASLYWDNTNARLGIGTAAPSQKLTVEGSLGILEGGTSPTYHSIIQGGDQSSNLTFTLPVDDGTSGQGLSTDGSGTLGWSSFPTGSGTATRVAFWNGTGSLSSNANLYWDNSNSRLGIGTAVPGQQLELTGNLKLPATTTTAGIIYAGSNPFIHNYGSYNIFMGDACGNLTLSGANYNIAVGDSALMSLTSGDANVAIGNGALKSVTTTAGNIGIGFGAGRKIATTGYNTIIGFQAGLENVTDRNTFIGCETGYSNTTGRLNVFIGHQSGYKNTTGDNSVGIGYRALYNQTGDGIAEDLNNTAVGYEALLTVNPTSSGNARWNTALGFQALRGNTTGGSNTAVGMHALYTNTLGNDNTALGFEALNANATGSGNTAIGLNSLHSCYDGALNTAIGESSLNDNTSGFGNTAVGIFALFSNTTGNYNTALGYEAGVLSNNLFNATAIGRGAKADADNQIQLGNGSVTSLRCSGALANVVGNELYVNGLGQIGMHPSSRRYKEDIKDLGSIDWLYKLRPVNFTYKYDTMKKNQYGLIAEEVEMVNPDFVFYRKGIVESVTYTSLISPMIKAIQEQNKKISDQDQIIADMKKSQALLLKRLEALEEKDRDVSSR